MSLRYGPRAYIRKRGRSRCGLHSLFVALREVFETTWILRPGFMILHAGAGHGYCRLSSRENSVRDLDDSIAAYGKSRSTGPEIF